MLDIKLIRENPEEIKTALLKRMDSVDFSELLDLDAKRREITHELNLLREKKNKASAEIPKKKKAGEDVSEILAEMKKVSEKSGTLQSEVSDIEAAIKEFLSGLPNIPDDDVVAGGKENNALVREWGTKPYFTFEPKNHVDLVTDLGLIDYKRGAKIGGNGYWLYTGKGALLEWSLLNFFIEQHTKDGYEFILPPHILTSECGFTAGQFPKFADDVFKVETGAGSDTAHFLLPTAETALVNIHRDEILNEDELPKKYFSYTPCYRREAGSYRTNERGMIRGHQFNKVEMFQYTTQENSSAAFDEMIGKAEKIVQSLGLHYQLSKLAAKDCSASMAKTYDIEVWIPSMNEYKEVSSASNARDYQSRRGNMRYRTKEQKSVEFCHTLNASGLATSRLIPAMVEQFQLEDGSVKVPEVLQKWLGTDILK